MADRKTDVKIIYGEKYFYLGITVYTGTNDYKIMTLKRDYTSQSNDIDHLNLIFDTFCDGTNAFFFGISPFGVRRELFIFNGARVAAILFHPV